MVSADVGVRYRIVDTLESWKACSRRTRGKEPIKQNIFVLATNLSIFPTYEENFEAMQFFLTVANYFATRTQSTNQKLLFGQKEVANLLSFPSEHPTITLTPLLLASMCHCSEVILACFIK